MTDDEKRQQKVTLLLEYQEAENDLAHLREKVGRLAVAFRDVGTWLSHASSNHEEYREDDRTRNAKIRTNITSYRKNLNLDDALAAMDEVVRAEELVRQLSKRKADLGLR